eukprot:74812_1
MYRVKTHNRQPIYFVVMGSVFFTDLDVHTIYDLKGSTHGRKAKEKEKEQETPVLKDLDFLQNNEIIHIGNVKAQLFKDQLRRDTELLRKLQIMDYSLLVGVHYSNREHLKNDSKFNGAIPSPEEITNKTPSIVISDENNNIKPIAVAKTINIKHLDIEKKNKINTPKNTNNGIIEAKQIKLTDINEKGGGDNKDNNDNATKQNIKKKRDITPPQSTTAPTNEHEPEFSDVDEDSLEFDDEDLDEDEEEEKKKDVLGPLPKPPSIMNLKPAMSRVASRRLSQIGVKQNQFTVKTP